MNNKLILIQDYLDSLFVDPVCPLNYEKDYELLMAVMLSAQTTDKKVNEVISFLFKKYNSLYAFNEADLADLRDIIFPLGNYNKKSLALVRIANRLICESNGVVPCDRDFLESLPMVGRKTTNVVLAEIFDAPAIAVDTHVKRVVNRLGLVKAEDVFLIEKELERIFPKDKWNKLHLQLVLFGRYYCKAKNPSCDFCGLKNICKYKRDKN